MLIAGNWKMFKGPARRASSATRFQPPEGVDVVFCPPFASLAAAVESGARIYAQNVHWEPQGAYTGEISAPMLLELGVAARSSATRSGGSSSARPTRWSRGARGPRSTTGSA